MVAGKIIGQRRFANPIQQSNTVGDQSQRAKLGETDMEMHNRLATSRRSFLSMAGMGAMATLLPTPVWSKLARQYPTITAEIEGYVATKKAAGAIAAIGHGLTAPDIMSAGTIAFGDKVKNCQDSGGVGAIIYNNFPGGFAGTLGDVVTAIPSVSAAPRAPMNT